MKIPVLVNYRALAMSLLYAALLTWIYFADITIHWAYMGFIGYFSYNGLALVLVGTVLLTLITPSGDARGYILLSINYILFIPSLVYIAFGLDTNDHLIAFIIMIALVYICSSIELPVPKFVSAPPRTILTIVFLSVVFGVAIQAWYGGMRYFNLDLERVYEFRTAAADELPALFGYLYSNISSVLVPVALLLAVRAKSIVLVGVTLLCSIALFGMTQHKIVLFGPFAILFFYVFYRKSPPAWVIGLAFLALPIVSTIEILIDLYVYDSNTFSYLTALLVRRLLFFPPVLDNAYIEYFSVNAKYYWSASQIGSIFSSNNYGVSAPYVIGYEYFATADTSANTGIIGSGYANAGMIGVAIYSAITGFMISILNTFGKRIDHGLVTAISLLTVYNVFTSTDLMTAFLTHGALLLFVLLAYFPAESEDKVVREALPA